LDFYTTVFEVIDMRSFSNLWYWIALAVLWSTTSHWVLGVPYDLVQRARREGGETEEDVLSMLRGSCNRLAHIGEVLGFWVLGATCAVLSTLAVLGFWYSVEFAQAVFLMLFPLSIVGLLSIRQARHIRRTGERGEALWRRMRRHRFATQSIGMVSIFITAMWGMYQNMAVGALG
jgi:hypothetical protein